MSTLTWSHCVSADCYDDQLHSHWLSALCAIVLGAATVRNNSIFLFRLYCEEVILVNEWILSSVLSKTWFIALLLTTSSLSGAARCSSSRKSRGRSLRVRTLGGVFSDRVSKGVDWIKSRSLGLVNWGSLLSPDKGRWELEFHMRDWCKHII